MHGKEAHKPSSTGHVVTRCVAGARTHLYNGTETDDLSSLLRPGCQPLVLHPRGEPFAPAMLREKSQIILIDGTWKQSVGMLRAVESSALKISLPMHGESRFWLRAQSETGHFSTMEALLFLIAQSGLEREHQVLTLQFELHVYTGLLSRGRKDFADKFLETSSVRMELLHSVRFLEGEHVPLPAHLSPMPGPSVVDTGLI